MLRIFFPPLFLFAPDSVVLPLLQTHLHLQSHS